MLAVLSSCSNIGNSQEKNKLNNESPVKEKTESGVTDMLKAVPKEFMVSSNISDTSIIVITHKCAVLTLYSQEELIEMKNKSKNEEEWETVYDDISYYANEASMFLTEKTNTEIVDNKHFIQFVMNSGEKITIDRKKAPQMIFFFNPTGNLKQCDMVSFDQSQYMDY